MAPPDVPAVDPPTGPPNLRPWAAVPIAVADALRPALPAAISHVIDAVAREVPAYSVSDERIAATLRQGVGLALARLIDLMGTQAEALDAAAAAVYEQIGAGEYRAGRGLGDLLSAYRVGARATWQAMSRAGVASGVSPAEVALLAEAVFAYIDEISSASLAGYAHEQVTDAGRREQTRSELLARILAGEAGSERVGQLADDVGWPLPASVLAIVGRSGALPAIVPGGLVGRTPQGPVALVPGPVTPVLRGWLDRAAQPMAAGLDVPLQEAARSLAHARALAGIPTPGSLLAADHLADLVIGADPVLGGALRAQALRPFDGLAPARRDPLLDTLRSWLLHAGNRAEVGADLHVHPQTVSYRMERVREVLGDGLDDPERRWELLLALMVERIEPPRG
jgi:hypothetical protein